jgi:hypothetical protein
VPKKIPLPLLGIEFRPKSVSISLHCRVLPVLHVQFVVKWEKKRNIILGSHSGGYVGLYLLGYKTVSTDFSEQQEASIFRIE